MYSAIETVYNSNSFPSPPPVVERFINCYCNCNTSPTTTSTNIMSASAQKDENKKSNRSFNLFNGRASTTSKTKQPIVSPHINPLVTSAPPSRSTSVHFEQDEKIQQNGVENHTSIEDYIAEKWTGHRVDFASRCTLSMIQQPEPTQSTYWSRIDGQIFNVRTGPNYKKMKKKQKSLPSLYDVTSVRCFKSNKRTMHIVDVLPLPLAELYEGEIGEEIRALRRSGGEDMAFPQVLVVHFWLPNETPNMFNKKEDGTGSEVVFYLRPSARFLQEVQSSDPSAAVTLFQNWSQTCTTNAKMRSRFKCMGLVQNLQELNSKWLEPYNGKPTLITESGSVRKGVRDGIHFLEMSVNVHAWAFLAKKSFVSLLPRFKDMQINVGFTIEALEEDDMPECILGCAGMNYIVESKLLTVPTDLQLAHS